MNEKTESWPFIVTSLYSLRSSKEVVRLASCLPLRKGTLCYFGLPPEPNPLRKYHIAVIPNLMHATNVASDVANG